MGCHRNMADAVFWTDEVVGKYGRMLTDGEHIEHMDHVLQEAVAYTGPDPAQQRAELDAAQATAEAAEAAVAEAEAAITAGRSRKLQRRARRLMSSHT